MAERATWEAGWSKWPLGEPTRPGGRSGQAGIRGLTALLAPLLRPLAPTPRLADARIPNPDRALHVDRRFRARPLRGQAAAGALPLPADRRSDDHHGRSAA